MAIILGLGITQTLQNIGEQIRRRSEIEIYPLHIAASCLLLLFTLVWLWLFWGTAEISWNLPMFLLQLIPAVFLALCAQVIRIDLDAENSPKEQYFENCKAAYLIWISALAVHFISSVILQNIVPLIEILRLIVIGSLIWLTMTRNPVVHWCVITGLSISVVGGAAYSLFEL